jgi:hypothetical protein
MFLMVSSGFPAGRKDPVDPLSSPSNWSFHNGLSHGTHLAVQAVKQVVTPGIQPRSAGIKIREIGLVHVLFDGDIQRRPALRSLFWQWGVTVGRLPSNGHPGGSATVEDCDAVVHLCGEADPAGSVSGAMPDGAVEEGAAAAEAAPLLVIGAGPVAVIPWITIPDPGPAGSRLKAALQSCQERARHLRGDSCSGHELEQFRDFLGHELRSPLTAIKTALMVLQAEGGHEPGSARMLRIALRNLARLTETVGWSQELMSLAEAPPTAELGPVNLATLARAIPAHMDVHLNNYHESRQVLTDCRLLGILAGQMERVLAYARPGSRPVFRLEPDPDSGECLLTATVAQDSEDTVVSRVAPTDGEEALHDPPDWNRVEFDHLVRMLISPNLLQILGVRPRIPVDVRGVLELTIGLPRWTGTPSPAPDPAISV